METVNNGNQPLQPYNHVLNDFSSRSGLNFDLSDGQKTTLNTILAQPEGEVYAKVYLGMAAAGVGLVAKDNPDSVKRLMQVLDGARQVWGGKNLDQQITSEKALHRLKTYTNIVLTRSAGTPLDNTRIGAIREDALEHANLHSGDVFEDSAALPRLYATPQPQDDARFISAGDDGQDGEASVESIFQHAIPQDRGAGDLIPGTDEAWSAQGVAERLNELLADSWDGTWDESLVLELTHGLNLSDRIKVSEAYAKIRSEAGYPEFKDARNRPLAGEAALNALYTKLVDELGTNSRDGLRIKAQFDPTNPTGQLQAHDVVMLDLKGFWSKNGDAIQRLLMNCDPAQIEALDASLQENYDITLEKACKKLRGEDEDRALFLISAPRVDGEVPESYVQAYEIHQAMTLSFFRKDPNRAFRQLEAMSESDLRDVAQAWAELYPKKGRGGDDGTGASIESSKFYKFTHRRMGRLSLRAGSGLLQDRFESAARGLRFEVDPQWSHAEHLAAAKEHRGKVADYCAVSFRLAGLRRGNQEDMVSVLGMVRPGSDVLGAMPRALDVFSAYNSRFPNEKNMTLTDIYNATSGEVEQLARITMEGKGFNSPEAAAIRLSNALDGGFLGLKGTKEEVVYEVLDQPDMTLEQRQVYLGEVRAAYAQRYGNGDQEALSKDLLSKLYGGDAELEIADGSKVQQRALALLENASLTSAERLVYAMNEPGAFGVFGKTDGDTIISVLAGASPLEKVVAMTEYARMTGRVFDVENGRNPLLDDLKGLEGVEVRHAAQLAQIMPQDVDMLSMEINAYLNTSSDPAVNEWIATHFGDPAQWLSDNFGDTDYATAGIQNAAAIENLRAMVDAAGGSAHFATAMKVSQAQLTEDIRDMVANSRGNVLNEMLMDFFGPHGAGLEDTALRVGEAVRNVAMKEANGQQITEADLNSIRTQYADLLHRVSQYDQLKEARVEMATNVAMSLAIAGTIIAAPQASPWLFAAVGAGTKTGTDFILGERRPVKLLKDAVRGGAAGLMVHFQVNNLALLSPDASIWTKALYDGVATARTAVGVGGVYRATELSTWEDGIYDGTKSLVDGAFRDAGIGFTVGALTSLIMSGIEDLLSKEQPNIDDPGGDDVVVDPVEDGPGTVDPIPELPPEPGDTGPGTVDPIPELPPTPGDTGPGTVDPIPELPPTPGGDGIGTTDPVTPPPPPPGGDGIGTNPGGDVTPPPPPGGFIGGGLEGTTVPPPPPPPPPPVTPGVEVVGSATEAVIVPEPTIHTIGCDFNMPTIIDAMDTGSLTTPAMMPSVINVGLAKSLVTTTVTLPTIMGLARLELEAHRRNGTMPRDGEWPALLAAGRRAGLDVGTRVPPENPEAVIELITTRAEEVVIDDTPDVPVVNTESDTSNTTVQPPVSNSGGADVSGTIITGDGRDEEVVSIPITPSVETVTNTPEAEVVNTPPVVETDIPMTKLLAHQSLQGASEEWVNEHLRAGLSFLIGDSVRDIASMDNEAVLGVLDNHFATVNVKVKLEDTQRALVTFGLPEQAVGTASYSMCSAATENALDLFGPLWKEQRAEGKLAVLDSLPQAARTAQTMVEVVGGAMPKDQAGFRKLGNDYKAVLTNDGYLTAPESGAESKWAVGPETMEAHRALQTDLELAKQVAASTTLVGQVNAQIRSGKIESGVEADKVGVTDLLSALEQLKGFDASQAKSADLKKDFYGIGMQALVNSLGKNPSKIAQFLKVSAGYEGSARDELLTKKIVEANMDDKEFIQNLARELIEQNVPLGTLPVASLDILDTSLANHVLRSRTTGNMVEYPTNSDKAAHVALHEATAMKKDLAMLMYDDLYFVLGSMDTTQAAKRLAEIGPNSGYVDDLAKAMGRYYNGNSAHQIELLQALANENPQTASKIIETLYKESRILWEYRDGFAREFAKTSDGAFHPCLKNLSRGARQALHENLLAGGLFNWGVSNTEEQIAAHIKKFGI